MSPLKPQNDPMEGKRLSKVLASAGIASRRASEKLIFEGKVRVNSTIVKTPQMLVVLGKDRIFVEGKEVHRAEAKVYYILNKPKGYICSNKREGTKRLVIDLFASEKLRVFTVGRLDRDTTGLLLVTNDGHFAQQVIHPSRNICKEYLIKTREDIVHEMLIKISKGTLIEGTWVKPHKVQKIRKGTLKIVVKEGKKREVRFLVQNAGLEILSLSRIRVGELRLGNLPEGKWREMSQREKASLFN